MISLEVVIQQKGNCVGVNCGTCLIGKTYCYNLSQMKSDVSLVGIRFEYAKQLYNNLLRKEREDKLERILR